MELHHLPLPEGKTAEIQLTGDTPEQRRVIYAQSLTLKGGTALAFGYGMPRYSTDLGFDGEDPFDGTTSAISDALDEAGLAGAVFNVEKDTQTTRRHMVHHPGLGPEPLKIEI